MEHFAPRHTRRNFLAGLLAGTATLATGRVFAEERARFFEEGDYAQELVRTPRQIEGPFYPDRLPIDTDNDLVVIHTGTTPAVGEITHLFGRVLDARGEPVRGMVVEIWQVDSNGAYLHRNSDNRDRRDPNFQGFGRFLTGLRGEYYFRTIKPVPYPGRTPHIHMKVKRNERELLTTQTYVRGHPMNATDSVLRSVRDEKARESLIIAYEPLPGSRVGELQAKFDIVLGWTPEDT